MLPIFKRFTTNQQATPAAGSAIPLTDRKDRPAASRLPQEIFDKIAAYDLQPADLAAAAKVSHKWQQHVLDNPRWRSMDQLAKSISDDVLKKLQTSERGQEKRDRKRVTQAAAIILPGVGTGVGMGVLNYRHDLHERTNKAAEDCAMYSHVAVNYTLVIGPPFDGNATLDMRKACQTKSLHGHTAALDLYPFISDNGAVDIYYYSPNYIGPFTDSSYNAKHVSTVAGLTIASMAAASAVCAGISLALPILLKFAQKKRSKDLEAGRSLEFDEVAKCLEMVAASEMDMTRAVRRGDLEYTQQMGPLFKGLDKINGSSMHKTFLSEAVHARRTELVSALLDQGAKFDMVLMRSLLDNRETEKLKTLLLSPNARQAMRHMPATALVDIIKWDNSDLAVTFIKSAGKRQKKFVQASENSSKFTPLHVAVYQGRRETAALLLKAGADQFAQDNLGITPSGLAQYNPSLLDLF